MKRSGRVANQNVQTCYDKYLAQMAERKDLCHNCCNYLDLPFKKKPQCNMGVHEFACLVPIAGGVTLPSKICSDVSVYSGTKRKAHDVDYAEPPCCNLPVAKKRKKQMSHIRRQLKRKSKKQKLNTNF
jgi:hypothetical protein